MKIITTLLITSVVFIVGALGLAYSGMVDVSASSPHSGFINWFLSTTSHASIERRAKSVVVPDLSGKSLAQAGVNDFEAMCSGCHGAPGKNPEAMGQGLNPAAPDLAEVAARNTPAELFWATKHGIRMTGMPAWGATHKDAEIWPVVAFMMKLPTLDAESYQAFLDDAKGKGHHDSDDGHNDHVEADASSDDHHTDEQGDHEHGDHDDGDSHTDGENAVKEEPDHKDDGHDHEH
ncbi:c-type cytochrome [Elongatibacter sediminis]|uniref:Cytochrome c n=1 Tax=Elongatibacter sediminis TaxID=3119006 RepID=A0AAW9RJ15_9GAMM